MVADVIAVRKGEITLVVFMKGDIKRSHDEI